MGTVAKRAKASEDTVVVHFRCKWCGVVMPALQLDATDLYQLIIDHDAREVMKTCDKCERAQHNTPVTVIRG